MTENTTPEAELSPTAQLIGDVAPKMVDLTDNVLFADVWARPELSPRDRSLVTIIALTAGGNAGQLPYHLNLGKENGLTEAEIFEALTHVAFYVGWPKGITAITTAKATFSK